MRVPAAHGAKGEKGAWTVAGGNVAGPVVAAKEERISAGGALFPDCVQSASSFLEFFDPAEGIGLVAVLNGGDLVEELLRELSHFTAAKRDLAALGGQLADR